MFVTPSHARTGYTPILVLLHVCTHHDTLKTHALKPNDKLPIKSGEKNHFSISGHWPLILNSMWFKGRFYYRKLQASKPPSGVGKIRTWSMPKDHSLLILILLRRTKKKLVKMSQDTEISRALIIIILGHGTVLLHLYESHM